MNIKPQDKPYGKSNEAHAEKKTGKGFKANFHLKLKCMALNINGIINIKNAFDNLIMIHFP